MDRLSHPDNCWAVYSLWCLPNRSMGAHWHTGVAGQIGIIPTDTLPAVVCDSGNREAVERLYIAKEINPKKPLSILVSGFSHIGTYTHGFPASNDPGARDTFSLAKQILPGPVRGWNIFNLLFCDYSKYLKWFVTKFKRKATCIENLSGGGSLIEQLQYVILLFSVFQFTLILPASKELPKQCIDYESGKSKQRRKVGVRWADNRICQVEYGNKIFLLSIIIVLAAVMSIFCESLVGTAERTGAYLLFSKMWFYSTRNFPTWCTWSNTSVLYLLCILTH